MAEPLTVHFAASGHSGSTLLDMILGGHSQISALGEAYSIAYAARGHKTRSLCTCGAQVPDCPFWQRVDAALAELTGLPAGRALSGLEVADVPSPNASEASGARPIRMRSHLHDLALVLGLRPLWNAATHLSPEVRRRRRHARNLCTLYEAARRAHGTPVVVDSTKDPGVLKSVWLEAPESLRVVVLERDGRAVCWSRMRREGATMADAARTWAAEAFRRRAVLLSVPARQTIRLRYEDLCADPEAEVARLCAFLGLAFEPAMLAFRAGRHNLGGNPMRLRPDETTIRLDEDWKRELSQDDLDSFERIAGKTNRRLGYGD